MTLQLPPPRPLPEPDRILASILEEEPTARDRRTPRWFAGLVAAVVVLVLAVVGLVSFNGRNQPQIAGPPVSPSTAVSVPTLEPAPAPTPTPTPTSATRIGDTLDLPYLRVTVGDPIRSGGLYATYVKTCVTGLPPDTPKEGVRLLRASWSLTTSTGPVSVDDPITGAIPLPTTYPDGGRYRVGQCVSGYVPFGIDADADVKSVDYRNTLGDRATWRANS